MQNQSLEEFFMQLSHIIKLKIDVWKKEEKKKNKFVFGCALAEAAWTWYKANLLWTRPGFQIWIELELSGSKPKPPKIKHEQVIESLAQSSPID